VKIFSIVHYIEMFSALNKPKISIYFRSKSAIQIGKYILQLNMTICGSLMCLVFHLLAKVLYHYHDSYSHFRHLDFKKNLISRAFSLSILSFWRIIFIYFLSLEINSVVILIKLPLSYIWVGLEFYY